MPQTSHDQHPESLRSGQLHTIITDDSVNPDLIALLQRQNIHVNAVGVSKYLMMTSREALRRYKVLRCRRSMSSGGEFWAVLLGTDALVGFDLKRQRVFSRPPDPLRRQGGQAVAVLV